jgi:hypothetical protein
MKEPEKENALLKRLVSDLSLDKPILKEIASYQVLRRCPFDDGSCTNPACSCSAAK